MCVSFEHAVAAGECLQGDLVHACLLAVCTLSWCTLHQIVPIDDSTCSYAVCKAITSCVCAFGIATGAFPLCVPVQRPLSRARERDGTERVRGRRRGPQAGLAFGAFLRGGGQVSLDVA